MGKTVAPSDHEGRLATAPAVLRPILELHAPVTVSASFYECGGCDFGGWEGDSPAWPCRTYKLAARLSDEVSA